MVSVLPAIGIGLLALACPLMMVGMGVGAWVVARARGQKKPLSMGCMGGQCSHEEHQAEPVETTEQSSLHREVARLEHEVASLRAREAARVNGDVAALGAQNGSRNVSKVG